MNLNLNNIRDLATTKKFYIFLVLFFIIAVGGLVVFRLGLLNKIFPNKKTSQEREWQYDIFDLAPKYTEANTLVPRSVSKNSSIVINLPDKIDKNTALATIKFTPIVAGDWLELKEDKKLIFKPSKELKVGSYYTVTIKYDEGVIGGDFLVEEDPEVLNVFPKAGTEAYEGSDISILFNRPMVPLSSLDIMAPEEVPVEIIPETPGRFKWIGTRSLQFIPDKDLVRSSNYSVRIKPEFKSMDGLGISGYEHKFITRKLRYEYIYEDKLIYNQPITIRFNQAVDLANTKNKIWIKDTIKNKRIEYILEYGQRKVYDKETDKYTEEEDMSVLRVFNKKDKHGREKFWDFEGEYYIMIEGATPMEGDIMLETSRQHHYQVSGIIQNISAESERSTWVDKNLFDPEGKLIIEFYEEIDLANSIIFGEKLINKEYGLKCDEAEGGLNMRSDSDCGKVTDRAKIVFTFDKNRIKRGESFLLGLEKIVNIVGQTINNNTEEIKVGIIPEFKVLSTVPRDNDKAGSLTNLYVCTNVPLINPAKEDIDDYIEFNNIYEFKGWTKTRKVPISGNISYYKCGRGEFQNEIRYGLIPEQEYELKLKLEDHFAGTIRHNLVFRTGPMPDYFLNFYHLQKKILLTTPNKTKLTFATENMEYVNVNICKLPAEDIIGLIINKPKYYSGPETINGCMETKDLRIDLEKRYWVKNYFQMDLKEHINDPFGHYLITFSNPKYTDRSSNRRPVYERVYLSISNIGIIEKKIDVGTIENKDPGKGIDNLFWITYLSSMEAIEGAKVKIFEKNPQSEIVEKEIAYTDNNGIVQIPARGRTDALLVSKDGDSAILTNKENNLMSAGRANSARKVYLYTDRPIYRPGHDVHAKGIYRIGYDNNYEIFQEHKVNIKVSNSRREEIYNQEHGVSEFGTFDFSLTLPKDTPLGKYYISSKGGLVSFDVEEYVPAAFKVDLSSDQEEYISGDTFIMDIDVSYYFGAPVEEAEVEYSIGSQDYYFDRYDDGTFRFGSSWYYCYWGCSYNDKFVLRNKTRLDQDGKGQITHKLDLDSLFKDEETIKSKIFVVYATIKNKNGQSVSAQKSFIIHRGEYYLGLKTDKRFFGANEDFNILLKSVSIEGEEQGVENIALSLNKLSWERMKRKQVDGAYYYKWEEKLEPIMNENVSTNRQGDFQKKYRVKESGQYRIVAKGTDSRGNTIVSSYNLYVYGYGQASVKPNNDHSLEIEANKRELNVGDIGEIIIKSPFDKAKALISLERGRIFKYEIVSIEQSLYSYKFKVEESHIPNVYVSVTLISPDPDIKYGSSQFRVNTREKEIDVDIETNKEHYLPGEEVELSITARDLNGKPLEAEFSLAVADLSVLALKGNPKKNPLVFFYGGFPLTVTTASNYKNILFEVDVPIGTKGGGGAEPDDLAKKKRGMFKDTALWRSTVLTDANGRAVVKFTLPDNLTTWQVEALGVTKDTKLGIEYSEFMARKNLMLTPLQPRFIVPGDEFAIGAKVFNQTDKAQELAVSFLNGDLELIDEGEVNIVIPAKKNDTVYFRVKAPSTIEEGGFNYTLSVANKKYEDTVDKYLKIRPNDTYETTATAGYSREKAVNEYVYLPDSVLSQKGGLKINTSATLAVFLSNALNSLINYPYGCSEQVASKLDAIAIIKKGLNLENVGDKFNLEEIEHDGRVYTLEELVEIGLKEIYKTQQTGGGFGYYPGSIRPSFYLSLHIANTLHSLAEAGYDIEEERIKRVFEYIEKTVLYDHFYRFNDESYIYATLTLSKLARYGNINDRLKNKIRAIHTKDKYINEDISSLTLANLAILLSENPNDFEPAFLVKVINNLENRIEIDSRGAYLPSNKNWSWYNYETPINNTSALLKALINTNRDNNLLDRILRWLLKSRYKDGAWGSTNNTLNAVEALVEYLVWQEENKSNFRLSINLNQQELKTVEYGPANIFEQTSLGLSMDELGTSKLNKISFSKVNLNQLNNNFYYDMALKYFLPAQSIPPRDEGFVIERGFYRLSDLDYENPVVNAEVGDVLKAHIKINVPKVRHFVSVEDFIPAGVELINFNLDTENISAVVDYSSENNNMSNIDERDRYRYSRWYRNWKKQRKLYPDFNESHDDRLFLFIENLNPGEYEYDYYVRVLVPGKFQWLPAQVQEMYFPENFGRTGGKMFVVNEKK